MSASVAQAIVAAIHHLSKCEFWGDDISYREVDLTGVFGHRQVTDSYLVSLAGTRRPSQVATFDRAFAARHLEACHLLPWIENLLTALFLPWLSLRLRSNTTSKAPSAV